MGQEDEASGRGWASGWAESIGQNIAGIRKGRGLTAQQLSDRCGEVGYPIPRSTIANIETGRKRDIPVQEVAVLALALGVPPVRLLYDIHAGATRVEVLPGVKALPVAGMEWFSGREKAPTGRGLGPGVGRLLMNDGSDVGLADARRERQSQIQASWYLERLREARERLADAEAGILRVETPGAPIEQLDAEDVAERTDVDVKWFTDQVRADVEQSERRLRAKIGELRQARAGLRAAGMTPPPLRHDLVETVEAMGGDV